MEQFLLAVSYVLLYAYYIFQITTIAKGRTKNVIAILLAIVICMIGEFLDFSWFSYVLVTVLLGLFTFFYSDEPIVGNRIRILLPGLVLVMLTCIERVTKENVYSFGIFCLLLFFLLSQKRGYLNWKNSILVSAMTVGIIIMSSNMSAAKGLLLMMFFLLESTLREYQMGYEMNARDFQNRLMQQQYEEIRSVYLNLRGWRHDYHNHIQALKAFFDRGQMIEARNYLNEIETELERVDSFVRSGNLMADAILNSKITYAVNKGIQVTCDATLSEELFISDMDLCIILGNILENAIESCEKIPQEKRFLRIYMAIIKEQLYISVQNSAPEILNFEERNYISTKRGNHGLGMKRVAAVVEKREGFLNLNNEPGIFGTEITIPRQG